MGVASHDDRAVYKKEVKNLKAFADKQKKLMEKQRKEEKKIAKKKKKWAFMAKFILIIAKKTRICSKTLPWFNTILWFILSQIFVASDVLYKELFVFR